MEAGALAEIRRRKGGFLRGEAAWTPAHRIMDGTVAMMLELEGRPRLHVLGMDFMLRAWKMPGHASIPPAVFRFVDRRGGASDSVVWGGHPKDSSSACPFSSAVVRWAGSAYAIPKRAPSIFPEMAGHGRSRPSCTTPDKRYFHASMSREAWKRRVSDGKARPDAGSSDPTAGGARSGVAEVSLRGSRPPFPAAGPGRPCRRGRRWAVR